MTHIIVFKYLQIKFKCYALQLNITLLSVQLSCRGSSQYDSDMLKKLRQVTQIQTELTTSHCHILRAHIVA